ncbi:siderophore-interacting protein [Streptomyces sp. NPDC050504]|uniref:siderophore-interacting protein n=1 Tax=Streptomyces sp. NPDC050504 TaxID=3365618 RepID=UPI0037ABC7B1
MTYRFFDARVLRTERLSPSMVRIIFGGDELPLMATAGRDQRFKLFLPHPGQDAPVVPSNDDPDWYGSWKALDPAVRGIMRTYTISALSRDPHEMVTDFALHGTAGPASAWATAARPGDRVSLLAPVEEENGGYDFRPPEGTDWVLLTADETALPAVEGILASLPDRMPVRVWIETGDAADRRPLESTADAEVIWLVREGAAPRTPDAIRGAQFPPGTPYAWVAGESATVKAVRRHLVNERGVDRRAVKFTGYWRRGASEDQLLTSGEAA